MEDSSNDSEKETAESMSEWYKELGITNPFFADDNVCIVHGDCRNVLSSAPKCGSAIVTDPPYELGFMGKSWDSKGVSFRKETWEIIRSTCLSGAPLLSFGGSRTQHRIACAIEDAGWEIRDTLMWVYGSGFPKSLDISKAIDKAKGEERKVVGQKSPNVISEKWRDREGRADRLGNSFLNITVPATPEAQLWNGYGTALKPAYEPIILAMNPMDKTFAHNALKYGVAGLNIDKCRVPTNDESPSGSAKRVFASNQYTEAKVYGANKITPPAGRFPANFLHDGSDEVMKLFPSSKGSGRARVLKRSAKPEQVGWGMNKHFPDGAELPDAGDGSAARFFYCAKASRSERNSGSGSNTYNRKCLKCGKWQRKQGFTDDYTCHCEQPQWETSTGNNHPTVKPLALMEYLCRLVKMPEHNLIIDPFMGSGTTLLACARLGIPCIGIDSDEQSCEIATIRYLRSQAE